jgi:PIN domain nuclease of toxin-antitoxin system
VSGVDLPRARTTLARLTEAARRDRRPICLDSSVLIDFIADQDPVASLLEPILLTPSVPKIISAVTLAELLTRPAQQRDALRVRTVHGLLRSLPGLSIVALDQRHAVETAQVRAETGLKLPDAAIVATARLAGAGALIGNDRQWRHKALGVPYHHMDDILARP